MTSKRKMMLEALGAVASIAGAVLMAFVQLAIGVAVAGIKSSSSG